MTGTAHEQHRTTVNPKSEVVEPASPSAPPPSPREPENIKVTSSFYLHRHQSAASFYFYKANSVATRASLRSPAARQE